MFVKAAKNEQGRIRMKARLKFATFVVLATTLAALSLGAMLRAEDEDAEESDARMTRADLPAAIMAAFEQAYPKAEITGVDKDTDSTGIVYEIESKDSGTQRTVVYTGAGALLEIEEAIALTDLPKAAQQHLKSDYPKAEITAIERATRGDAVTYEVLLESGEDRTEIVFDHAGQTMTVENNIKDEDEEGD